MESITLEKNQITDSRGGSHRVAILLGPDTQNVVADGNTIQGFAKGVEQAKKP